MESSDGVTISFKLLDFLMFFFPNFTAEEVVPEPEPKFNPFTGSGRRLDGRPLAYEPPPASFSSSSSKDKQPVVANGNGQSSVPSSSEKAARQAQGKLVFGANANRAPKETPKVLIRTLLINDAKQKLHCN